MWHGHKMESENVTKDGIDKKEGIEQIGAPKQEKNEKGKRKKDRFVWVH